MCFDENYALPLTGTIDSNVFASTNLTVTDTLVRLEQYEKTIEQYIINSVFNKIVFVENSNYPFDYGKYEFMAMQYGKRFEYIY